MSKLLSLFGRGGGSNTDAIRQSTSMTMAYLLEQNRKFEFFMREKVEELERLVSAQQTRDELLDGDDYDIEHPIEEEKDDVTEPGEYILDDNKTPLIPTEIDEPFGTPLGMVPTIRAADAAGGEDSAVKTIPVTASRDINPLLESMPKSEPPQPPAPAEDDPEAWMVMLGAEEGGSSQPTAYGTTSLVISEDDQPQDSALYEPTPMQPEETLLDNPAEELTLGEEDDLETEEDAWDYTGTSEEDPIEAEETYPEAKEEKVEVGGRDASGGIETELTEAQKTRVETEEETTEAKKAALDTNEQSSEEELSDTAGTQEQRLADNFFTTLPSPAQVHISGRLQDDDPEEAESLMPSWISARLNKS